MKSVNRSCSCYLLSKKKGGFAGYCGDIATLVLSDRTILPEQLDLECWFGLKFLTRENRVGIEKKLWGEGF
jgi:hypothetical protein